VPSKDCHSSRISSSIVTIKIDDTVELSFRRLQARSWDIKREPISAPLSSLVSARGGFAERTFKFHPHIGTRV
jgi:hypothetical protein